MGERLTASERYLRNERAFVLLRELANFALEFHWRHAPKPETTYPSLSSDWNELHKLADEALEFTNE